MIYSKEEIKKFKPSKWVWIIVLTYLVLSQIIMPLILYLSGEKMGFTMNLYDLLSSLNIYIIIFFFVWFLEIMAKIDPDSSVYKRMITLGLLSLILIIILFMILSFLCIGGRCSGEGGMIVIIVPITAIGFIISGLIVTVMGIVYKFIKK
ncbi:hypothetical protein J4427_01785 [Candidatus Woesearchaeota archaeon]|nr:hypothetical protein [Candidatus Woesearchaeota archaeon]